MTGAERIAAERKRQIEVEGWTPEHDAQHRNRELVAAACCYAQGPQFGLFDGKLFTTPFHFPVEWPWDDEWYKSDADPIRMLEKAGALIAAEIDRLTADAPATGTEDA